MKLKNHKNYKSIDPFKKTEIHTIKYKYKHWIQCIMQNVLPETKKKKIPFKYETIVLHGYTTWFLECLISLKLVLFL